MRRCRRPLALAPAAIAAAALVATLGSPAATAQLSGQGYTPAGSGMELPQPRFDSVSSQAEDAPWHFGRLRVLPWIGLSNASWRDNVRTPEGELTDDVTATGGAGLSVYLPIRSELLVAAFAVPEYVWWRKLDERNELIGRYGAGLFGNFNRVQVEVVGRLEEDLYYPSAELLDLLPAETTQLQAATQVEITAKIALAASARRAEISYEDASDHTDVATDLHRLLGRETTTIRGGVRYLFPRRIGFFGLGVQSETTDFEEVAERRSNEGESLFAEIFLDGNDLDLTLDFVLRELDFGEGDDVGIFEEETFQVGIHWSPGWRLDYHLYGSKDLRYSVLAERSFFTEERLGGAVSTALGRRGTLAGFYEVGDNRFPDSSLDEDIEAWGVRLGLELTRRINLTAGYHETVFDSAAPGLDRTLEEVTVGLGFSGFGGQPGTF